MHVASRPITKLGSEWIQAAAHAIFMRTRQITALYNQPLTPMHRTRYETGIKRTSAVTELLLAIHGTSSGWDSGPLLQNDLAHSTCKCTLRVAVPWWS